MLGAGIVLVSLPAFGWSGTFIVCGLGSWLVLRESPAYLMARGEHAAAVAAAGLLLRRGEVLELPSARADRGEVEAEPAMKLFDRRLLRLNLGVGISFFFVALVAYGQLAWTTVMFSSAGLPLESGVSAILAFNLCSVTAATLTGFAIRRFGSRSVLLFACMALLASVVLLGLLLGSLGREHDGSAAANAAIVLVGLCGGTAGSAIAAIYAMMAEGYPQSCRGLGLGYGLTLGRAGGIVLSLLGGVVLDVAAGAPGPFFAILAASALLALSGPLISDRHAPPATRAFVKAPIPN
jgi:hypothetical protein